MNLDHYSDSIAFGDYALITQLYGLHKIFFHDEGFRDNLSLPLQPQPLLIFSSTAQLFSFSC